MATDTLPPVPVGVRWEFNLIDGGRRHTTPANTNAMAFAILLLDRMAAAWGEDQVQFPTPIEGAAGLHDDELLDQDDDWPTPTAWQDALRSGTVVLPGGRRMWVVPLRYDKVLLGLYVSDDVDQLDLVLEVLGAADARALRLLISSRDADSKLVGYVLGLMDGMPSLTLPTTLALTFVRRGAPHAVTLPAVPTDNPLA